jgi:3-phosphoinositide dependent protein kinase-1
MFKRDPSEAGEASFDAGAAWDALVLGDEIPWVGTDQESRIPLEFAAQAKQLTTPGVSLDESAISEESGPPPIHRQSSSHDEIADKLHEFSLQPHIFPKQARGSFSTSGSNTVSQDSSSSEPTSKDDVPAVVKSTSREELLAPYLASLSPTETVVLSTSVVPRPTFRQRASSIISVSPIKLPAPPIKRRQLVLTSERLLCLKLKDGRPPTIKAEIPLTTKHLLVERKSEKEFTVVVSHQSYVQYCNPYTKRLAKLIPTLSRTLRWSIVGQNKYGMRWTRIVVEE